MGTSRPIPSWLCRQSHNVRICLMSGRADWWPPLTFFRDLPSLVPARGNRAGWRPGRRAVRVAGAQSGTRRQDSRERNAGHTAGLRLTHTVAGICGWWRRRSNACLSCGYRRDATSAHLSLVRTRSSAAVRADLGGRPTVGCHPGTSGEGWDGLHKRRRPPRWAPFHLCAESALTATSGYRWDPCGPRHLGAVVADRSRP